MVKYSFENMVDKELFEVIVNHSNDGLLISDKQGRYLFYNDAFKKIIGLNPKIEQRFSLEVAIKEGLSSESVVEKVILTKEKVTKRLLYEKTKKEAIVTGVPVIDVAGALKYVICNIRDVSDIKELERKLAYTEDIIEQYRYKLIKYGFDENSSSNKRIITFRSKMMNDVYSTALKVAKVGSNILVTGETGVGKEVVVRLIHEESDRKNIMKVDCASIPETLLEGELFGYEAGAFTGADRRGKPGKIELADNGTLFLDEIGDMPQYLQSKLLNVLQEKKVTRLGGIKEINVNFRLIAATNQNLDVMVEKGVFRKDLYFRLYVIPLKVPPLRERAEDIPVLIQHFLEVFLKRYNIKRKYFTNRALDILCSYSWPGNVRELENLIERLVVLTSGEEISENKLPKTVFEDNAGNMKNDIFKIMIKSNLKVTIEEFEKQVVKETIENTKTLKEAAENLGIDISTLVRKKQKYYL